MLRQIVYSSHADPETHAADLSEILRCSRRNNPELGITGVLILSGRASDITYTQAIEGEDVHVALLIEAIMDDPRHSGIEVLLDHRVERRAFAGWSMGDIVVPPSMADAETVQRKILDALRGSGGPSARGLISQIALAAA